MTGYTKLFSSIIASTIWREPHTVRIVWITMLALANKDGSVEASLPGLADLSRVTIQECKDAIQALSAPDEYSRTPDHDGRRIEPIEGGWRILNHAKYRAKMNLEERREYLAEKKREERKKADSRQQLSTAVNKCRDMSTLSTHAEAEAEAYSEAEAESTEEELLRIVPLPPSAPRGFEEFWKAYPRRLAKGDAERAWKKMKCERILPLILTAIREAKASEAWTKEGGQFIPYPATWLKRKGWEDQHTPNRGEPGGIKRLPSAADALRAMGVTPR